MKKICLFFFVLAVVSCQKTSPHAGARSMNFKLSDSLEAAYKKYIRLIEPVTKKEVITYGLFVDKIEPDSSVYYFSVIDPAHSEGKHILGISHIDSVAVFVFVRTDALFQGSDTMNKLCLETAVKRGFVPNVSRLQCLIDMKCVFFKDNHYRTSLISSSPFMREKFAVPLHSDSLK